MLSVGIVTLLIIQVFGLSSEGGRRQMKNTTHPTDAETRYDRKTQSGVPQGFSWKKDNKLLLELPGPALIPQTV